MKKADRKKIHSLAVCRWRRALWMPRTTRKMSRWVLEQEPETSLEAKMTTLKPSHFGHFTRRQGSLEKTVTLGNTGGSGKGGGQV